jgi:hypothetical protein
VSFERSHSYNNFTTQKQVAEMSNEPKDYWDFKKPPFHVIHEGHISDHICTMMSICHERASQVHTIGWLDGKKSIERAHTFLHLALSLENLLNTLDPDYYEAWRKGSNHPAGMTESEKYSWYSDEEVNKVNTERVDTGT